MQGDILIDRIYDVTILGAGPSGFATGIYAGRTRLDTLLIEKEKDDGQITITDEIENYSGRMVDDESGPSLTERMARQAEKFGTECVCDTIISVDVEGPVKTLIGSNGTYKVYALIITTGTFPRPIDYKGESEFMGKGVSCCVTCDASFLEDLEVFAVGDDDSTVEEATYLIKFARKVIVIYHRDELRAVKSIQGRVFKNPGPFFVWGMAVEEFHGDDILSGMTVKNVKTGEPTRIDTDEDDGLFGIFGLIGHNPGSELFEGKLEMDRGYIKTNENMHTNVEGVYVVGDIRIKSLRQVVTATADGAVASMQAEKWLAEQK